MTFSAGRSAPRAPSSPGIHIDTNVWHQPVYPIGDEATFYGKQGAVHACVAYDSVEEHGKW